MRFLQKTDFTESLDMTMIESVKSRSEGFADVTVPLDETAELRKFHSSLSNCRVTEPVKKLLKKRQRQ